ncbi:MAG TPA: Ig-like domain-containing protein [Thermoanaerobaculia bacterium]|nr:Ig-like domain-containing protein [Thermoanaerobaculia bacterium]
MSARAVAVAVLAILISTTVLAQGVSIGPGGFFDPNRAYEAWRTSVERERAEAQRRKEAWDRENTAWFERNGFSAATPSGWDPFLFSRAPLRGAVINESTVENVQVRAAFYQLGNQAQYAVPMGAARLHFQGAVVRLMETWCESDGCLPGNWIHAFSGWAEGIEHQPSALTETPERPGAIYSHAWMKGHLTREAILTRAGFAPSTSCGKRTATYVYRYRYHSPDGATIQFYQRPKEVALTSTWSSPVSCTSTPIVPREPDHYWSAEGNAALDTSNKCLPVIRWADGSTEEFHAARTLPDDTGNDGLASPYMPSCSAADLGRDLRHTDSNGNIRTYRFTDTTETMIDASGRQTVLTFDTDERSFRRLRSVELPSIGNAPPQRYTIHWRTPLEVRFDLIWPDLVCRSHFNGTVQPCSSADGQPAPSIVPLVDSITTPDGRSYRFEYGPWGNLTRVTEPGGAVREWQYGGAANLAYGRAAAVLYDRVVDHTWLSEAQKMHARGVVAEVLRPDGAGGPAHVTSHAFTHRTLDPQLFPSCVYDSVGAGIGGPAACSQVWREVTMPDGSVRKTGVAAAGIPPASASTGVPPPVIPHGWLIGEETWAGASLVAAMYKGDPATGELWYGYDSIRGHDVRYSFAGNVRTLKLRNVRDGLATTSNFLYASALDIDPAPDVVESRNSAIQTSVCTFAGVVAELGCAPSGATPLVREDAEVMHYFAGTFTGLHHLGLVTADRLFAPNANGIGFSTTPLVETIKRYDEFPLTASGRPSSVLDTSKGLAAGSPRGNLTTTAQRVSATKSVSVRNHYFDTGIFEWTEDPKGSRTTHAPDFSLCTSTTVLTSSVTNAKGHVTRKVEDCASGLPLRITDANGKSTYTQYDAFARAVEVAGPGDVLTALPRSGVAQPYTRDPAAPTGSGTRPGDAAVTSWSEYLDLGVPGRQRTVTHAKDGSPGGHVTKVFTDGLGRSVQTRVEVDPATTGFGEVVSTTVYDGHGRVAESFTPCFAAPSDSRTAHCGSAKTTTTFDALDRATRVVMPGNRTVTHAYGNESGRWLRTTVDARGFTSKTYSDLEGREVEVRRQSPLCGGFCSTKSAYDAAGRLLSLSDHGGNTIRFTYDDLSRRLTMADPDMGTWSYGYDDNSNLTSRTDAKGQEIRFSYDVLNRLTLKDLPPAGPSAEDVSYFYDGDGPRPPADAPTVAITSPQNGQELTQPVNVTIAATATSESGIEKVEFFHGSTLLGQDTEAPYTFVWKATQGLATLTAKATSNSGIARSASVSINVKPPNKVPVVSITSPRDGETIGTAPAIVVVEASASDADGIASVELWAGAVKLATLTAPPYRFVWSNVPAGTHALKAVAVDTTGLSATSATVTAVVLDGGAERPQSFVTGRVTGALRADNPGFTGFRFTVGSAPLRIMTLGRLCISGNSLDHAMKLIRVSDNVTVGTTTVSMSGCTAGQFKYAPLPATVTLAAGADYLVVSNEIGSDLFHDWTGTTLSTTGVATVKHGVYTTNGGQSWGAAGSTGNSYVPVDFQYAVPAPRGFVTGRTAGTLRADSPGMTGFRMTVGSQPIDVTSLGRLCIAGNALDHELRLIRVADNTTVAATTVAMSGCAPEQFKYAELPGGPVTLAANTDYLVVSNEVGSDRFQDWTGTVLSTTGVATVKHGIYTTNGGQSWGPAGSTGNSYVPVDFQYMVATSFPFVTSRTVGSMRADSPGLAGFRIAVGAQPIAVTALGRLCISGNSLTHDLKLIRAADNVTLATVPLSMSGCSAGQFRYATLSAPVRLAPGAEYLVVSNEVGSDLFHDWTNTVLTTAGVATIKHGIYTTNGGQTWGAAGGTGNSYVPVDFRYVPSN